MRAYLLMKINNVFPTRVTMTAATRWTDAIREMTMKYRRPAIAIGAIAATLLAGAAPVYAGDADSREIERGRARFANDCSGCHGSSARGDGVGADILAVAPSDLTVLAKQNGGQFPETVIYRMIDGRDIGPNAHGKSAMPVWGQQYQRNAPGYSEQVVEQNIGTLIAYLRSIQVK